MQRTHHEDKATLSSALVVAVSGSQKAYLMCSGHKSYNFLNSSPDYHHDCVIHRKGQFAKRDAENVNVSTNSVEGLFGRMKRFMRHYRASPSVLGDGL